MESHRQQYQVSARGRQNGITAIGFLILVALFGIIGLAGLRITPMYLQKMRLDTILDDIERDYRSGNRGPTDIRLELNQRFAVEGLRIPRESISISQGRNSYIVRVQMENRQAFLGDLYFLIAYDRQVEIPR
jgi:Domain of unknown function (DUF4845)